MVACAVLYLQRWLMCVMVSVSSPALRHVSICVMWMGRIHPIQHASTVPIASMNKQPRGVVHLCRKRGRGSALIQVLETHMENS